MDYRSQPRSVGEDGVANDSAVIDLKSRIGAALDDGGIVGSGHLRVQRAAHAGGE